MGKNKNKYYIDDYVYNSDLVKYSPEIKLTFSIFIIVLCLVKNSFIISIYIIITMSLVNVIKNKISFNEYFNLLKIPIAFVFIASITLIFDVGYSLENGFYINITKYGACRFLNIFAKSFGAINALYFLVLSTPVYEIIDVLKKLNIPLIVTELMNLIYRYIFLLLDIQFKIKVSAESRLGYKDFKTSCSTFGSSVVSLFLISIKRADMHYNAMISRCYNGRQMFLREKADKSFGLVILMIFYVLSLIFIGLIT